jgi:hypothetical protein
MNRPTNITVIAILQLISGIFNIFDCLILLFMSGLGALIGAIAGGNAGVALAALIGGVFFIFAMISLALGLMSFILSMGLFQLNKWAWIGTFIVQIVALIMESTKLFGSGGVAVNFLTVGFAIVILYYLMRPEVKQAFSI